MERELDPLSLQIVEDQLRLSRAARDALPQLGVPCLAHMRLLRNGHARDVLLGARSFVGSELAIIDWQDAPLAGVFFACREGEEFEVEVAGQILGGTLVQRNLLEFARGELVEIVTPDRTLSRRNRDHWVALRGERAPLLCPRSEEDRARPFAPVVVELDPGQRRAVDLPSSRSLLVLGEAGYGKTTVALHRLASLRRQARASSRTFPTVVIVPTRGLQRLAESMLERLGVEDTKVEVFDQWVVKQARQVFAELPERTSEDIAPTVTRFKRHPAVRVVLPEVTARPGDVSSSPKPPAETHASRRDLLHLWGDQKLLARVAGCSDGGLTGRMIDDVVRHTRVQFSQTTEEESTHIDADRLATLDGLSIDRGTPMQDAGTMDTEDCAVLFELNRLRTGGDTTPKGRLTTYQHIVIDEAQEFAPLELALIGRALSDQGALTVAGDERQQIDPAACFDGWPATLAELGAEDYETVTLQASHRCPPEISALGRSLFDSGASGQSADRIEETRDSRRIALSRFPSQCHLEAHLIDELSNSLTADPRATFAIVCRSVAEAVRLDRNLGRGLATRLALGGEFDFRPGVSVTCVAEVKGLEFDYVIVPDASAARYPDTPESRRALYVAVTRAIHQVWLTSVGTWSPILPRQG